MITRTNAYQVGNKTFATLEEAKASALLELLGKEGESGAVGISWDHVAERLVKEQDKIVDILTTGPRSKPRSRKINGGKRHKTPKEVAT